MLTRISSKTKDTQPLCVCEHMVLHVYVGLPDMGDFKIWSKSPEYKTPFTFQIECHFATSFSRGNLINIS